MATIKLNNIRKSFGKTRVLNGVNLDIHDGEFLTLVGPSGCGKSTLLRTLAGLEAPDSGEINIADQRVNETRAAARNLAMVFQSYALYPHLTVSENMVTPLKLRDLSFWQRFPVLGPLFNRKVYRSLLAQVQETAEILKIDHLLERKPGQLSGGQRQRAALGRAMVRKPAAFLMDEPLSNLDAALRVHMRTELSQLHRTLGTTFVYVTHDQAEALTMSDRMAVMMGGDILQLDKPSEVYKNPTDIRVAEFIGSPKINILPGNVSKTGSVSCLGTPLHRTLKSHNKIQSNNGNDIQIGIRPEHLKLVNDKTNADFSARLLHRENLGADIYLHAQTDNGNHRLIIRAQPQDSLNISIGDTLYCTCADGEAMAFSKAGIRLPYETVICEPNAQVA